jgi:hypothetical protein
MKNPPPSAVSRLSQERRITRAKETMPPKKDILPDMGYLLSWNRSAAGQMDIRFLL